MNHFRALKCSVLLVILGCVAGCAETPLDGKLVAEQKGCVACHGSDGTALSPSYPNLHGQWSRYIRVQLLAYRDGDRENGVMNGMAASLTDAEIRALAELYGD